MATTPADQPNGPSHGAPDGAVVVGIDGREQDRATLTWAAREALSRNAPVHIISAIDMDLPLLSSGEAVPLAMVEEQLQVDLGRRLNRRAIELYAQCKATDTWPGFDDTVHTIGLPSYAIYQQEELLA